MQRLGSAHDRPKPGKPAASSSIITTIWHQMPHQRVWPTKNDSKFKWALIIQNSSPPLLYTQVWSWLLSSLCKETTRMVAWETEHIASKTHRNQKLVLDLCILWYCFYNQLSHALSNLFKQTSVCLLSSTKFRPLLKMLFQLWCRLNEWSMTVWKGKSWSYFQWPLIWLKELCDCPFLLNPYLLNVSRGNLLIEWINVQCGVLFL